MNSMGACGDPLDERPHHFDGNTCTRCGYRVAPIWRGAIDRALLNRAVMRLNAVWLCAELDQNQIATVTESRLPLLSGDGMSGDDQITPENCEIEFDRTGMQSKIAAAEVDVPAAYWLGADGLYEYQEGRLVKMSEPIPTVQPTPEHADKPHHFLQHTSGHQWIATWYCGNCWLLPGYNRTFDPWCDFLKEWRYLGPAEWREPEIDHQRSRIQALEKKGRAIVEAAEVRIAELEENARWNTQQFDAFQDDNQAKFARICDLENEIALMKATPVHTDDPRATDPIGQNDEAHRSVEETIGHIVNGRVIPSARAKVRAALDKADAPPTGRAASDAALGRLIRK